MSEKIITEKEKQHYVPQFYLRNFSTNNKSIGMYLFSEHKLIRCASIKDNFNLSYYYGEDGKIEDGLAELEGKWNIIIKQVINTHILPTSTEDLLLLRLLFLLQSVRTKYKGDEGDDYYTKLISNILSYEDFDLYSKIKGKFKIKSKHPTVQFIDVVFDLIPQTYDLKINLIINESNLDFISSDNPVVFCNQLFESKKIRRGFGIANIGIQYLLPISPNLLLCMYDPDVYDLNSYHIKHTSKIKKINSMIINNSYESLVFKLNDNNSNMIDYIKRSAKKRATANINPVFSDNILVFSNRQLRGNYDLSNFFTIKEQYVNMKILDHTEEEIKQQLKNNLLKQLKKKLDQGELQKVIANNEIAFVPASFHNYVRPWASRFIKDKEEN